MTDFEDYSLEELRFMDSQKESEIPVSKCEVTVLLTKQLGLYV
jgi:hypothetical protein